MKRALVLLALALALGGCSSHARPQAPSAAVPPPPPASTGAGTGATPPPAETVPPHAGTVTAPWDTAGTASGKASRRNHVYPNGTNALGQELVDSLPDPAALAQGAVESEPAGAKAPPAPAPAAPAPPVTDRECWEVQVLVTTSESKARDEAKRIEKSLNLAAWVRNDGSIYRVRVGGCLTSDGATELANRLKQEAYPEAFRVMREQ
jgi:hypothetical protein